MFLFLQGHPEYDADALLREYRRDVGRFLGGERESYPEMPHGYFDAEMTAALAAFRESALRQRRAGLIAHFPTPVAEKSMSHAWRGPAVRLYRNWLHYLREQRSRSAGSSDTGERRALAVEYQ